jgi:signal transduction histidine kinase
VLALGLAAAAVVARGLAGPLHRLAAVTRRVAAGDLTVRAEEQGSAEQRQLAYAFNDMTDRLERMIRSQRQFVADASHQLRTPLTGVRLRLEEASVAAGDRPVQIHLDRAMTEVDRLSAIVAELLVLSRASEAQPGPESVGLVAAARAAGERWAAAAAAHGAQLVLETSRGASSVSCAGADVDRILDALLENALAYGPDGQTVRLLVADRRVEVHDQGPGPAPGEEEVVFARFHRGAAARNGPAGTGLGLPIARELARRWGGDVTLTATRDGGRAVVTF